MNLLQIRTKWIGLSGRFDLVVDLTNYTDNGANFFIQAGQRILDSIVPYRKESGRYIKDINADQSSLLLKYVRAFEEVWLSASGVNKAELDRKSYSWLLQQYGSDYGEKATGLATFSDNPDADETVVVGSETYTFKTTRSTTYEVEIGDAVADTIDNLVSEINTYSSVASAEKYSSTQMIVEYYLVGTAGNSIAFTTTASNISLDGSGYLGGSIAGRANQVGTGQPNYYAPIVSTPHPQLTLANIPSLDSHDILFGTDRFAKDGILFMPPADQSYTMTIFCKFFSVLESDQDVSYHSENYPELLILATNLAMEMFYRNTEGVKDALNGMEIILKGIDHDLVHEEMNLAGNTLRG